MKAVCAGRAGSIVAAGLVVAVLSGCMTTRQGPGRVVSTQPMTTQAAASRPGEVSLTRQERIGGLLTVYATARQHFAYFGNVPDVDWDKAFVAALAEVEPEQSPAEYYLALERYISLLGDGHTGVTFPPQVDQQFDHLPLRLGRIEAQWVVVQRMPSAEILAEDVPPGTVVRTIDGVPAEQYMAPRLAVMRNLSPPGRLSRWNGVGRFRRDQPVRLGLRYPDGREVERVLRANRKSVQWDDKRTRRYGIPWSRRPHFRTEPLDDGLLYIRYGACNDECTDPFARFLDSLPKPAPRAMIIDLRGNGGGSTPSEIVRRLIIEPGRYWQMRTRCSISYVDAQLAWHQREKSPEQRRRNIEQAIRRYRLSGQVPRGYSPGWINCAQGAVIPSLSAYKGPLVVLIDGGTGSAAEDMLMLLRSCRRGTFVGEATGGSTGQPIFADLPGGGSLRVCTPEVKLADGTEFTGKGIVPDIVVERTIRGLAEGRDEVLEAALQFLRDPPATQPGQISEVPAVSAHANR